MGFKPDSVRFDLCGLTGICLHNWRGHSCLRSDRAAAGRARPCGIQPEQLALRCPALCIFLVAMRFALLRFYCHVPNKTGSWHYPAVHVSGTRAHRTPPACLRVCLPVPFILYWTLRVGRQLTRAHAHMQLRWLDVPEAAALALLISIASSLAHPSV